MQRMPSLVQLLIVRALALSMRMMADVAVQFATLNGVGTVVSSMTLTEAVKPMPNGFERTVQLTNTSKNSSKSRK